MNGIKQREYMEDFIIVAANLQKRNKNEKAPKDEAALINYLQKLYG